jgi:hypothetical protein
MVELASDTAVLAQAEAKRRSMALPEYVADVVSEALTHEDGSQRISRSLALLQSLDQIGDEQEQRDTFEFLKQAIDEDRTSTRHLFG